MKYKIITTYGIAVCSKNDIITAIPDISTSKRKLKKLIRKCNKLKLAPEQLSDVVEDFISI
ncbi:MAG: hypothetical protein IJO61_07580 [Oscillospiraceae bacterium]|nr:hypothetical protein [Oscillospiraceae bacterium]